VFLSADTPALVLAPMDGVTDALMRGVLTAECPFTYCVTEFIRVSAQIPPAHIFLRDVPELHTGCRTASGVGVQVQLLGGDPDTMATAAERAVALGAQGVDINFGCPAPTVNRHDGGATLLKYPDRIEAIVRAVRSAVPSQYPVSAKLRLGWDDPRAVLVNAERAARGGAAWLTIHGRTKMQGYTPPAYWKPIGEVQRNLAIPIVANGEIWTLDDLKRCQEDSGCQHFMLGRGVLARPQVVAQCARHLGLIEAQELEQVPPQGELPWTRRLRTVISVSLAHGERERKTLSRLKQWLNYAHKFGDLGSDNQPDLFEQIKRVGDLATVHCILDSYDKVPRTVLQADAA
jgi:tRNA-dihydrouridine synthase C